MHYDGIMHAILLRKEMDMPALQVRDFPDDLYEELRLSAQQDHRSIAQQTIVAVEEYLRRPSPYSSQASEAISRRQKVLDKISARPSIEIPESFPSPEQIVRELRDQR